MDMTNTNRSKSASRNTASSSKCPLASFEYWSMLEYLALDRDELDWLGRGFNSRIAFWTMVRFAQERAHSRKTRFPETQSSRPLTRHRSAFAGSRVSRNES